MALSRNSSSSISNRALLATDDMDLYKLLSAVLEPGGFDLKTVSTEQMHSIDPDDFTLLVFDGDMKFVVDGGLPVVIVISPADAIAAYDNGADLVLQRPLSANVTMAKIKSVMRRYNLSI